MDTPKVRYALVAVVTVVAAVIFGSTAVRALWYAPDEEVPPSTVGISTAAGWAASTTVVSDTDVPARLRIPALSVDAAVEMVGVNAAGRMATPSHFSDVAWYKYGPLPGQTGSAVIDGHVDNGLGLDGVFKHLNQIRVGDEVDIVTKSKKTLAFTVTNIESYPYQQVPTDLLFNRHDTVRLNLVSCEGTWVPGDKTYDHRLVAFAVLKS